MKPREVNLTALFVRLTSTWRRRVMSPRMQGGMRASRSRPARCLWSGLRGEDVDDLLDALGEFEGWSSSSILPDSILEKSRIS